MVHIKLDNIHSFINSYIVKINSTFSITARHLASICTHNYLRSKYVLPKRKTNGKLFQDDLSAKLIRFNRPHRANIQSWWSLVPFANVSICINAAASVLDLEWISTHLIWSSSANLVFLSGDFFRENRKFHGINLNQLFHFCRSNV